MNWVIMPYVDNHAMTADALRDVLNQRILGLRVLAIDNGGREKGYPLPDEEMDSRLSFWRYQPPLLSLSTVWNTALKMVWDAGGKHALVVNNDIRLPRGTYAALEAVQQKTGAWFVSACNVGERWYPGMLQQIPDVTDSLLASRGGPDFSCYLITRECHQKYPFDEQFIPAYCEDVDLHRRMMLGGDGARIFSVPVPYLHYGSGTLRQASAEVRERLGRQIDQSRAYYQRKWGGPVNQETFLTPFGQDEPPGGAEHIATPDLQRHGCTGCRRDDDTRSAPDAPPAVRTDGGA